MMNTKRPTRHIIIKIPKDKYKASLKRQLPRKVGKWNFSLESSQTSETEKQAINCISNNSYLIFSSYCILFSHFIFLIALRFRC